MYMLWCHRHTQAFEKPHGPQVAHSICATHDVCLYNRTGCHTDCESRQTRRRLTAAPDSARQFDAGRANSTNPATGAIPSCPRSNIYSPPCRKLAKINRQKQLPLLLFYKPLSFPAEPSQTAEKPKCPACGI